MPARAPRPKPYGLIGAFVGLDPTPALPPTSMAIGPMACASDDVARRAAPATNPAVSVVRSFMRRLPSAERASVAALAIALSATACGAPSDAERAASSAAPIVGGSASPGADDAVDR